MPERLVSTNGVELNVVDEGRGPAVVLCHGFPDLSYSWRHQIRAVAAAGYRVLAPDQRGYGRSSRPEAIEDYDIEHLTGDIVALLDDIGEERAVVVGHDWGAMVANNATMLHPDRFAAVCTMSVPMLPRAPMPPVQMMRAAFADTFFYIVYFQEPGVADADLGADPATTMRRMLAGLTTRTADPGDLFTAIANDERGFVERLPEPDGLPDWLGQGDLDHYVAEFTRTGFTGGINWYRNFDRNWELTEHLAGAKQNKPAFFVAGAADPVILMTPPSIMDGFVTDLRGSVIIEGAGHWVQQEKPGEVNAALLGFLADVWPA
jgi:pimeloyl-ACP methyl ester carboxylesterase